MRSACISSIQPVHITTSGLKQTGEACLFFAMTIIFCACGSDTGTPANSDESKLRLVSVVPSVGVSDMPVTGLIAATFSEDLDPQSLTNSSFVLAGTSGLSGIADLNGISGKISYFGRTATFKPLSNLKYGTAYSVLMSSEIKSLSGRFLVDTTWTFKTEGDSILPDPPPPP